VDAVITHEISTIGWPKKRTKFEIDKTVIGICTSQKAYVVPMVSDCIVVVDSKDSTTHNNGRAYQP
jgi:hypothetical protein